jgi:ubiquinone/menaquinone biosynthesis C-methylase UbiE
MEVLGPTLGYRTIVAGEGRGASQRFFDVWSRTYDNPLLQAATYRPTQDAVLRALRGQQAHRILDLGSGTGLLTTRLVERLGVHGVGCDYSWGMVERAARRSRRPDWVQGDAMALPIRGSCFDAVICTESFHWYRDQERALGEISRVLAPGGRAYLALVNPPTALLSGLTARWSRAAGQPLRWPTPAQMREMGEGAGFRVLSQRPTLRLPASALFPTVLTVLERPA